MELKDVILSTLAEIDETGQKPQSSDFEVKETITNVEHKAEPQNSVENKEYNKESDTHDSLAETSDSELIYLKSIRERLLVLFEGFQAPNNTNIEAKVDMTLNFLEYILATIDNRVDILEKGNKQ